MPFLRNVTAGRNVPDERLAVVAEQYELFGGASPINAQNLALIDALRAEFDAHGIDLPIYFGNRNWEPYVADTVRQMRADGVRRALVLATSAFSSYSGCRQYREDLERAAAEVDGAPELHKLRLYYNHPGFIDAVVDRIGEVHRPGARLVFTAHSIPNSMAQWCEYQPQLHRDGRAGRRRSGSAPMMNCRRVGPLLPEPQRPAPGPVAGAGRQRPPRSARRAGRHRRDPDAARVRQRSHGGPSSTSTTRPPRRPWPVGIDLRRAPTVGTHPSFITGLRQLVEEQIAEGPVLWVGEAGPWPDPCPDGHCLAPA